MAGSDLMRDVDTCDLTSASTNACCAPFQTNDAGTAKTLCLTMRALNCGPAPTPTPSPTPTPAAATDVLGCWTATDFTNTQGLILGLSGPLDDACEVLCDQITPTPNAAAQCTITLDYQ